jgi:DNA polymerase
VFIGNVLKCRPPDNRDPQPDEVAMCSSYIIDQIEIIQPKVICCLGAHSARLLTGDRKAGIGSLRGTFFEFNGHKAMSTYHPAYLLYGDTLADLKKYDVMLEQWKEVRDYANEIDC